VAELLSRAQITSYLSELAEILGEDGRLEKIVVVGGALLAHYGIRDGTRDVDTVRRVSEQLKAAAAAVAERHDLAPDWLNARAAPFRPATLDEADCEVMLEKGRLLVLAAPIDQVFLMKLNSARSIDQADLVLIWPRTSFKTAEEVVDAYWEAFPEALDDEHLVGYIQGIIIEAEEIS
jgi:hypothetical protein